MDPKIIRQKYFDFFIERGHALIPSASLVPIGDASVLFNTSGMQHLAPYFLGSKHPYGKRLVDIQKCLRTVDFENVGDNTHHTFFQMLGNWSMGDYFKEESIKWSFEFLTNEKWLNLPLKMLAFTCYKGDDLVPRDEQAASIWKSLGVNDDRIAFLGKDNFWSAGEKGPCGPSSEIFYWAGEGDAPKRFDDQDERWVEIWNNVFMAYNRIDEKTIVPLVQKNVDTGMGFERVVAVLNGKKSAYETDLFMLMIKKLEEMSSKSYGQVIMEMRIIVDHIRSAAFLLGDTNPTFPSNLDRGYILRRLIRRAIRYARLIGIEGDFASLIGSIVVEIYGDYYKELVDNKKTIVDELKKEEDKFSRTLEVGLREFNKMAAKSDVISGKDAFLLFQSYGFPIEMTQELALEQSISVDEKVFLEEFEKHQELSRTASSGKFKGGLSENSPETTRLHTATHLLLEALRRVVSKDIRQRGSNITTERLRFDFSFDRKLTSDEVRAVENEINRIIDEKMDVKREEMNIEDAKKLGAQMEFGAKYPDIVSVYFVGNYSKEFCGGPHVKNTGEMGKFKIKKEQSSSAGVRRIKAVLLQE
jgi:alanyl-tRNA synthetase